MIVDMLVACDTSTSEPCADVTNDNADDDNDEESFEQLFEQLRVMKGCCCLVLFPCGTG